MEYILYLLSFLVAGYLFGKFIIPRKKSDLDIKILMAKAQLEFFRSPEGKEHQKRMNDLYWKPPLPEPINFGDSTWIKTKK